MTAAFIIIDVQNDFMPGGSLAVAEGDLIIPVINALQTKFNLVLATQDWHPAHHKSFASNHSNKKPFEKILLQGLEQTLWPDHCVQGTKGAELHPRLETSAIEAIFKKGIDPEIDSYSGFYDNGRLKNTGLADFLHAKNVKTLYFSGLCADICVYFTIKDALAEGFKCVLIEDATRPLDENNFKEIKRELLGQGVEILKSGEIGNLK
ncbi:MAG: bifunctional nicotinamidase/pyrazinamidase [Tatlockia sp.]|nr:bifunctional nicotinamidase/pyrazinamidase [Tatlockia sp.]